MSLVIVVLNSTSSPLLHCPRSALAVNRPKGLRLLPGPPGKFIFGNESDMLIHHEWKTVTRPGKEYGGLMIPYLQTIASEHCADDLVYVKILGWLMVFVNSADVALDLFREDPRSILIALISL